MTRLNRKVEYALMALRVMAGKRAGELTSAKEIVDQTGCPFDATARVLQLLAHNGVLRSEHGACGGYVLVRDLNRVSFHELSELILGPLEVAKCLHSDSDCTLRGRCNIVSPVQTLNRRMTEFFQNLSVGELLKVKDRAPAGLGVAR